MRNDQLMGTIGAGMLLIGAFSPLISIPLIGQMTYVQDGQGDGIIVVFLALASLVISLVGRCKWLWITGLSCIPLMVYTFIQIQYKVEALKWKLSRLEDNPFQGLAVATLQTIQFQWGWAFLIMGAVLVISAAATRDSETV